ncbi:MAG: translation initiation factor [Flavobacteriaceae bacterium]
MSKNKLNSLADLAKLQFDNLAPDPEPSAESEEQVAFQKQYLEAHFSNKGRAGKTVTLIKGFEGENEALKALAKQIKNHIGTGGTVKNGEILIQGNFRDQIMRFLIDLGHQVKRVGG